MGSFEDDKNFEERRAGIEQLSVDDELALMLVVGAADRAFEDELNAVPPAEMLARQQALEIYLGSVSLPRSTSGVSLTDACRQYFSNGSAPEQGEL